MKGVVKTYNSEKGFGFITSNDGDVSTRTDVSLQLYIRIKEKVCSGTVFMN